MLHDRAATVKRSLLIEEIHDLENLQGQLKKEPHPLRKVALKVRIKQVSRRLNRDHRQFVRIAIDEEFADNEIESNYGDV